MITFSNIGHMGRLANQMFQFASTVGIARKRGFDVKFPIQNFKTETPDSYDGCKLLECFDIPESYLEDRNYILSNLSYIYNELDFKYNNEVGSIPDKSDLFGYFQNEKYFKECENEIRKCFSFKDKIIELANLNQKIEKTSVSVHVRRGDYLKFQDHHPTQDIEFYKRGIEITGKKKIYIFSDDLDWCYENFKEIDGEVFFIEEKNPYVSLYMMTLSEDNVISNSSYSWWGAWLNENPDKKVIGPSLWFGNSIQKDTSEILPSRWIRI